MNFYFKSDSCCYSQVHHAWMSVHVQSCFNISSMLSDICIPIAINIGWPWSWQWGILSACHLSFFIQKVIQIHKFIDGISFLFWQFPWNWKQTLQNHFTHFDRTSPLNQQERLETEIFSFNSSFSYGAFFKPYYFAGETRQPGFSPLFGVQLYSVKVGSKSKRSELLLLKRKPARRLRFFMEKKNLLYS